MALAQVAAYKVTTLNRLLVSIMFLTEHLTIYTLDDNYSDSVGNWISASTIYSLT